MSTSILRRPGRPMRRRPRLTALALAALLGLGSLAACSAGSDESGAGAASGGGSSEQAAPDAQGGDADRAAPGSISPETARLSAGDKLVRQVNLQLKVESLMEAAERIRTIATTQKGAVLSEEMYSRPDYDDVSGTITISVPSASLDATIALVEKVGEVQFRTTSTQDVTGTYVDTEARVKSLTASVERVRNLLSRATSVGDLVALENELSRRQADLDALTAQLSSLESSVQSSPITVSLSTGDFEPVAAGGFMSGLRSGWEAFTASLTVLATALGAILPFAVAGALLVVPALAWWRRRRVTPALARPAGPPGSA